MEKKNQHCAPQNCMIFEAFFLTMVLTRDAGTNHWLEILESGTSVKYVVFTYNSHPTYFMNTGCTDSNATWDKISSLDPTELMQSTKMSLQHGQEATRQLHKSAGSYNSMPQ